MGNPEPNPVLRAIQKGIKNRIGAETRWKLFEQMGLNGFALVKEYFY